MIDLTRYGYDPTNGAYSGETVAHASPLEPGVLLEPAFATTSAPPEAPAGKIAVWSGSEWTLVPDHRGETWYRERVPVRILAIGDPAALGLASDPAPVPPAPPPDRCTKLGLKRAFAELGIWPLVRAMIAADPDMQEEWDLAVELKVADPIVQKAIGGLAQGGIALTDAQVGKLLIHANELVA